MKSDIEQNRRLTKATLESGLANSCADDITEAIINMTDGTCNYVELIPILEDIGRQDKFWYFDDNGAGGMPHPDSNRETNFKSWAAQAIKNLQENDQLITYGVIGDALKSNSTNLIELVLEHLEREGTSTDKLLIPILEKIARKNVYKSYSYIGGFQTDCELGTKATNVLEMIQRNIASKQQDHPPAGQFAPHHTCSVCSTLPDDITVNTGREYHLPDAFKKLKMMSGDSYEAYYRCPECHTYYEWINMPQMYGSGKNDEERLVRQSQEKSKALDASFENQKK